MAAFEAGLAAGADGLELDVHLSRDGRVVVHHDRQLDRTTNLRGPVAAHTADELARADAGYRFEADGLFPFRGRGIGVPTLADVLARFPDVRVIIELKVNTLEMARAVVGTVRAADAVDRVCIGSFGLTRASRDPRPRTRAGDQRLSRRSSPRALSIVVPLAGGAPGIFRISDAGEGGLDARRVASVRAGRPPRRARRAGVDGGHGRRCAAAARLGRRRVDHG